MNPFRDPIVYRTVEVRVPEKGHVRLERCLQVAVGSFVLGALLGPLLRPTAETLQVSQAVERSLGLVVELADAVQRPAPESRGCAQ